MAAPFVAALAAILGGVARFGVRKAAHKARQGTLDKAGNAMWVKGERFRRAADRNTKTHQQYQAAAQAGQKNRAARLGVRLGDTGRKLDKTRRNYDPRDWKNYSP